MAELSFSDRQIKLRLVWFGAAQSGCGTNVRQLHRMLTLPEKTEIKRVGGRDRTERIWQFSYEPEGAPPIADFRIVVQCTSVPGSDESSFDRDELLEGVDGIVFVADARAHRAPTNIAAALELERLLLHQGLSLADIPLVFQINQTDAANARPAARVLEDLDPVGLPWFEAMARQGRGVREAHDTLLAAVMGRIEERFMQRVTSITLTATRATERDRSVAEIRSQAAQHEPPTSRTRPTSLPAVAEIVLRPIELREQTPLRPIRTLVIDDRLHVEALYRNPEGDLRKLAVLIEPGAEPLPRPNPDNPLPTTTHIPLVVNESRDDSTGGRELSSFSYGVIGVIGGLICGVLAAMLVLT